METTHLSKFLWNICSMLNTLNQVVCPKQRSTRRGPGTEARRWNSDRLLLLTNMTVCPPGARHFVLISVRNHVLGGVRITAALNKRPKDQGKRTIKKNLPSCKYKTLGCTIRNLGPVGIRGPPSFGVTETCFSKSVKKTYRYQLSPVGNKREQKLSCRDLY